MQLSDFETLVRRLADEIPDEFLTGIAEIVVSPRTVAHPERNEIFTLGECIPLPAATDEAEAVQSRVVLYYGSFAALARDQTDFDWHAEAWETLTHEIRHHVEWRAREPALESLDEAVEQNYARLAGEPFDAAFYRDGERLPGGMFRVEDDYFIEVDSAQVGHTFRFAWAGERYRAQLPDDLAPPAFLSVQGLAAPPPGELVLVVVRPPKLFDVLKAPEPDQREIWVEAEER
ncbi:MAG: metallopeptidase family protein [Gemmatimonadales bacterium]